MILTNEKPLENYVTDGGFCGIFHTIGVVGDSLSSGEFESTKEDGTKGYHDYYDYSWGQFIARACGSRVFNFSRGGMSARWFNKSFGEECGFYKPENVCQCYIMALGVNDLCGAKIPVGDLGDLDKPDYDVDTNGTFAAEYERILRKIKEMQPKARIFLITMPRSGNAERDAISDAHAKLLYKFADAFEYTYVIDLYKYAPIYDDEFRKNFFLGGHMNAMGYLQTARFVMSYMDYIIRHNMEDFVQIGFVGTEFHNNFAKW